jgi:hypothetical protein
VFFSLPGILLPSSLPNLHEVVQRAHPSYNPRGTCPCWSKTQPRRVGNPLTRQLHRTPSPRWQKETFHRAFGRPKKNETRVLFKPLGRDVASFRGVVDVRDVASVRRRERVTWQASAARATWQRDERDVGDVTSATWATSPPFHVYSRTWDWYPGRGRTPGVLSRVCHLGPCDDNDNDNADNDDNDNKDDEAGEDDNDHTTCEGFIAVRRSGFGHSEVATTHRDGDKPGKIPTTTTTTTNRPCGQCRLSITVITVITVFSP